MSINNIFIAEGNINKPFFAYIALYFAIINMADIKYMAQKLVKYRCETDDQINVLLLWLKGIKKKKKKKKSKKKSEALHHNLNHLDTTFKREHKAQILTSSMCFN